MGDRVRIEPALRKSEARQGYLLALGDALRPLADPLEIQATASFMLGQYLDASRVVYFEVRDNDYVVERDYTNGVQPLVGRYPVDSFGPKILETYLSGQIASAFDVATDMTLSEAERAAFAKLQIGSYISVPLIKNGQFVGGLSAHAREPRKWTLQEIARVEETAERTWSAVERARAEQALARSEEKYRTLFTHIDEAFAICELVYDANGRPIDRVLLEANPRYQEMTGAKAGIGSTAREIYPNIEDHWFDRYHEVVTTGNAMRIESHSTGLDRWFDVYLSRVGGAGSRIFAAVFNDITERKRREVNLAFLSEISSDLVSLTSVSETMTVLGAKICRFLNVASCGFVEIHESADRAVVQYEWHREGVQSIAGTYRIGDFLSEELQTVLRAGREVATDDVHNDPRVNAGKFSALGMASLITLPIIARGQWRFAVVIHDSQPRRWRDDEIELVRELIARIWARLERARGEEALQASDERHRALFSQMVGGVAEADLDGRFTNVNRRYCEMVGYSAAELLGMRMADITHAEDLPGNLELLQGLTGSGEPYEIEKRYLRRDGSVVWVHNSVSAVRDSSGKARGIIVVSVDITRRRQQEEQVRLGAELLTFLIDRSPYGFYIVDADFRISHVNADSQARAFRNINPAIGRRFDEAMRIIWPEAVAAEIIDIFWHTLRTGDPYLSPGLVSERADLLNVETYDWQLERITMPDGRHAVVCYYYDTTRLREAEQQLRDADRRKDEFLATLAHELRNPLAPVRNGLHILRRNRGSGVNAEAVYEMMERQLSHMVRLVDDLMEVSRITRGQVELRKQRVDLATAIHGAIETSKPLIETGKHQLEVELSPEPLMVEADAVRLTQVFANLLNNAAKYTNTGGQIWLSARREGGDAVVSVRDSGIGIPADMLVKVFDLFTQADRTDSRAQGGLGIGLTLVRSMVQMHDGSIDARSDGPGRGSEFVVRLPLA